MEKIKIAIAGGGIASLCLAHSLTSHHPDWEIKVFEANPEVREEGAGIGLSDNAQDALRLISPSLREAVDEAGGVRCQPTLRIMIGTGPHQGAHAGDVEKKVPQITVHRTHFWRSLRKRIPEGVLQMGKKLKSVDASPDQTVRLTFTDDTTYLASALIGCDGVNSIVRGHVLGPEHPATKPYYTQGYNHRVVVPMAEAEEAFGREYCAVRTQMGWIGDGGFFLTDHCDEGRGMQCIVGWSNRGPWPYETPFVEWDRERIKKDLEGWGWIGERMSKIFLAQPKLYAAAGKIHRPTPTYTKGPVCIAGDAAQAFPPAQGAGAGQAIEDALVLSTVLNDCNTPSQIPLALSIYDCLRRPRRSAIAQSSIWAGKFITGRDVAGTDPEKIRKVLPHFHKPISGFDLAGMQREARERMVSGEVDLEAKTVVEEYHPFAHGD